LWSFGDCFNENTLEALRDKTYFIILNPPGSLHFLFSEKKSQYLLTAVGISSFQKAVVPALQQLM